MPEYVLDALGYVCECVAIVRGKAEERAVLKRNGRLFSIPIDQVRTVTRSESKYDGHTKYCDVCGNIVGIYDDEAHACSFPEPEEG